MCTELLPELRSKAGERGKVVVEVEGGDYNFLGREWCRCRAGLAAAEQCPQRRRRTMGPFLLRRRCLFYSGSLRGDAKQVTRGEREKGRERESEQTPGRPLSSEVPTSPQAEKAPVGTCVATAAADCYSGVSLGISVWRCHLAAD